MMQAPLPSTRDAQDQDLAACQPTTFDKAAGASSMFTGLFTALQSIQLLGFTLLGLVKVVPFLFAILGVAAIVLGFYVMRLRGWATLAAAVLAGFIMLFQSAWVVYGLAHGYVSLVGFGVPPIALAAAVLCGFVVPRALRADAARQRLAQEGLSTGM